MITIRKTPAGLTLTRDGLVCDALDRDPEGLAETIRDLIAGRAPGRVIARLAGAPPYRPLFQQRDREDRRRAQLAEERASLAAHGQRLARARRRHQVETR